MRVNCLSASCQVSCEVGEVLVTAYCGAGRKPAVILGQKSRVLWSKTKRFEQSALRGASDEGATTARQPAAPSTRFTTRATWLGTVEALPISANVINSR
jgi:hypothetical protein